MSISINLEQKVISIQVQAMNSNAANKYLIIKK